MHLKHLVKIFPLVFLFAAGVYFAYLAVTKSGVLGESYSSPPSGSATGFYIMPNPREGFPSEVRDLWAMWYDGTNWTPRIASWEFLKPEAGRFYDYEGGDRQKILVQLGSTPGEYSDAVRAICHETICQGKEAKVKIKIQSSTTPPPSPTPSCGDNVCNYDYGEDCVKCSTDCGTCPSPPSSYPVCGNAVCEVGLGEKCDTCSADCGTCTYTQPPSPSTYCEGFFMSSTESYYSCVKNALGSDFDYWNAKINGPDCKAESKWFSLKDKAMSSCFNVKPGEPVYYSEPPPEVTSCLNEKLGEDRYRALASGSAQPTSEEHEIFEGCYSAVRDKITYTSAPTLDDKTKACLILAVGEKAFNEINGGTRQPTPEESDKGRKCFGTQTNVGAPPPVYTTPEEMKSCIVGVVSESRYEALKKGRWEGAPPTAEEQKKIHDCYTTLVNPAQKVLLPVPPEIVPVLEKHDQLVISAVKTEFRETEEGERQPRIVLSGVALPDTLVDIYIFSDPIVLSTRTDSNGVWTYYLEDPLDPGDHSAYVVTRQEDGSEVRSDLFSFRVAAAAPGEEGSLLVEGATPTVLSDYLLAVAGAVAIGLVLVLGLFWVKTRRPVGGPPPVAPV